MIAPVPLGGCATGTRNARVQGQGERHRSSLEIYLRFLLQSAMTATYEGQGNFEWDPDKARSNSGKHRVTFEEALSAFRDPLSLTIPDPDHSVLEKTIMETVEPEMRAQYSFQSGQRGRYAHLFPQKPHLVVLSPDMAAVFPDSDSVNEALRTLVKAVQGNSASPREREAA